jgi:hypothetical protein
MVPSISFSGRECRHADKIFAFPARTEFSVTTTEIFIPTGQKPIRISLAPASGDLGFGILTDQIDYDGLLRAEMEDDIELPQLGFVFNEFLTIEEDATDAEHQ